MAPFRYRAIAHEGCIISGNALADDHTVLIGHHDRQNTLFELRDNAHGQTAFPVLPIQCQKYQSASRNCFLIPPEQVRTLQKLRPILTLLRSRQRLLGNLSVIQAKFCQKPVPAKRPAVLTTQGMSYQRPGSGCHILSPVPGGSRQLRCFPPVPPQLHTGIRIRTDIFPHFLLVCAGSIPSILRGRIRFLSGIFLHQAIAHEGCIISGNALADDHTVLIGHHDRQNTLFELRDNAHGQTAFPVLPIQCQKYQSASRNCFLIPPEQVRTLQKLRPILTLLRSRQRLLGNLSVIQAKFCQKPVPAKRPAVLTTQGMSYQRPGSGCHILSPVPGGSRQLRCFPPVPPQLHTGIRIRTDIFPHFLLVCADSILGILRGRTRFLPGFTLLRNVFFLIALCIFFRPYRIVLRIFFLLCKFAFRWL